MADLTGDANSDSHLFIGNSKLDWGHGGAEFRCGRSPFRGGVKGRCWFRVWSCRMLASVCGLGELTSAKSHVHSTTTFEKIFDSSRSRTNYYN